MSIISKKLSLNDRFATQDGWINPLQEDFKSIESRIKWYMHLYELASQENEKLKDKHFKDKELKEMKEKLETYQRFLAQGFSIDDEELELINNFQENHNNKIHKTDKKSEKQKYCQGGVFKYVFVPTSLGIFGTCVCETCEKKAFAEAKGDLIKFEELKEKYNVEFDFYEV